MLRLLSAEGLLAMAKTSSSVNVGMGYDNRITPRLSLP